MRQHRTCRHSNSRQPRWRDRCYHRNDSGNGWGQSHGSASDAYRGGADHHSEQREAERYAESDADSDADSDRDSGSFTNTDAHGGSTASDGARR